MESKRRTSGKTRKQRKIKQKGGWWWSTPAHTEHEMAIASAQGFNTTTIAAAFGRDRTVISYALRSVSDQCDVHHDVAKEVKKIAKHVKENIIKNEL